MCIRDSFYAVSPLLEANNATAEPFLLLPAILGLSVSLSGRRRDDLLAGFLLGLATLMKQNGAFLLAVPVLATAALSKERGVAARVREAAWRIPFLGAGWLVPLAAAGLYFAAHRALGDFVYETFTFMMTQRLGDTGVLFRIRDSIVLSNTVLRDHPFLPAGALASLALLLPVLREREPVASGAVAPTRTPRASVLWTFIWLAVSAAMVSAGGRPFPHYLQLLVPPLCLLGFLSIQELWPSRGTAPGRAALLVVAGFLFLDTGAAMVRGFSEYFGEWTFRDRPFTWAEVPVGEEIRSQTSPGETILVWGPKPAVYYFAQRSAPGRFYSLLPIVGPNIAPTVRDAPPARADVPGAMDELRASFDRHPPVYFVYAPVLPNYDLEQPQFAWLRERIAGEYRFEKAIREYQLYRRIEHSPSR
ncbi:MAG: hypothetical protein QUU85_10180, partial [Candidatus Eisenbacteria bacterium]|nr:hypothetical protein [Candidatus Eisenbacteria bacterium]